MTPKIRGIVPTIRRHSRPSPVGHKRPSAAVRKVGQLSRALDLAAEGVDQPQVHKFEKGELVDVLLDEEGLYGSWHPAVICAVKRGSRQVQFEYILDDKQNQNKEWVAFGKERLNGKSPSGGRKKTENSRLRPGGPGFPPAEPSFRKTGGWPRDLWVECYSQDAWWEGVLVEDISASQMEDEDSVVDVVFPKLGDLIEQVAVKNIRECKDWDEETGLWTIRGRCSQENSDLAVAICPEIEPSHVQNEEKDQEDTAEDVSLSGSLTVHTGVVPLQPSSAPNNHFGSLISVVEQETSFLLKVYTSGYTLDQMRISVDQLSLAVEVTSNKLDEKHGNFTCQLCTVLASTIELPSAIAKGQGITWELNGEDLVVTVPRVASEIV